MINRRTYSVPYNFASSPHLIKKRHTSTSGVRLQPLESMPTPKPKNFSKKKLKKRKERNRLSVNSKTNNRARIIDPRESIHLIMKHLPKNFPDFDAPGASSNDEGFSSEVPTSRRDENPGIVLSKVLTTMAEENENKEGDIKTDGGGDPHPKIWQLGQELYKTEEGVQDPNYVLYEEKDKDNLLSSGGHINETLGNKISFEKLLHPIVESLVLRTISETIQEESEEGTRLSTHN